MSTQQVEEAAAAPERETLAPALHKILTGVTLKYVALTAEVHELSPGLDGDRAAIQAVRAQAVQQLANELARHDPQDMAPDEWIDRALDTIDKQHATLGYMLNTCSGRPN